MELDNQLKRIQDKLQQLLKRNMLLEKQHDKLKAEFSELTKKLQEKDDQLELMSLRMDVLKASKGTMDEDEKKTLEKRISQYVKEIDKCIALMNE